MTPGRLRKAFVLALGLLFAVVAALGASGPAAAAQNAPSWSTGDTWSWTYSSGGTTHTRIWTVGEQSAMTLTSGTYTVWHVNESQVSTTSSGSTATWDNLWFQAGTLSEAKSSIGTAFSATWDPPMALAIFPLNGNSWSLQTTRTLVIFGITTSSTITYTGSALGEQPVAVPAGSFNAAPVRVPSSGAPYTLSYYSDAVGNFVRIDSYNSNSVLTRSEVLMTYKYQAGALGLFLLVIGAVVLAGVAAAIVLYVVRHRRPRYPTRYAQAQPLPPQGMPPPPQGPPQGPPGM